MAANCFDISTTRQLSHYKVLMKKFQSNQAHPHIPVSYPPPLLPSLLTAAASRFEPHSAFESVPYSSYSVPVFTYGVLDSTS